MGFSAFQSAFVLGTLESDILPPAYCCVETDAARTCNG